MSRTYIIHLGTHKTGTSVIQRFLAANEVLLARQGCNFIRLPSSARKQLAHPGLSDEEAAAAFARALEWAVRRSHCTLGAARSNQVFLLSWEGFSGDALHGYVNAPLLARRLRLALGSAEARLILYLRRQDDFVESMYSQFVRQGREFSFSDYLQAIKPGRGFDWAALCDAYAAAFGVDSLSVRLYQRSLLPLEDSILRDFCVAARLAFQDCKIPEGFFARQNQGWSRSVVELARLSYAGLSLPERKQVATLLDCNVSKTVFERYSYFSTSERLGFLSAYCRSNERVADIYLSQSGARLFDSVDDEGRVEASWPGLTPADLVPVLARLLLGSSPAVNSSGCFVVRVRRSLLRRARYFLG